MRALACLRYDVRAVVLSVHPNGRRATHDGHRAVVHMVAMLDRFVSAARPVLVVAVVDVLRVGTLAFIPVAVVKEMDMPIVEIVDVITVNNRCVPTIGPVLVVMLLMNGVDSRHASPPCLAHIGSQTTPNLDSHRICEIASAYGVGSIA
jgi:hypothetical protein